MNRYRMLWLCNKSQVVVRIQKYAVVFWINMKNKMIRNSYVLTKGCDKDHEKCLKDVKRVNFDNKQ